MVYRVGITVLPVDLANLTVTNLDLPDIPPKTLGDFTFSGDVLTGTLAYSYDTDVFRFESTGFVTQELTAQELEDNPSVVLIPSYEISKIVNNGNTYKIKDSYAREQIETLTPIANVAQLLKYEWFDHIINDQSWLEADTFSWQDGTVYSDVYNHLDDDYTDGTTQTETVGSYTIDYKLATDGHKIVPASEEATVLNIYNESGVAWYYILDRTNQRFKLPRENPAREELIQVIRAKGNDIAIGFTDGTNLAGVREGTSSWLSAEGAYGVPVGTASGTTNNLANTVALGITKDSTKSGIVSNMTDSTSVYKGKKYLYFYVGGYSQTALEQTAGLNASLFNNKVDIDGSNAGFVHIVSTYHNGSDYYRIYSDGWCEQGGFVVRSAATTAVTFHKKFVDTNYNLQMSARHTTAGTDGRPPLIYNPTTTGFTASIYTSYEGAYWKACGYIA